MKPIGRAQVATDDRRYSCFAINRLITLTPISACANAAWLRIFEPPHSGIEIRQDSSLGLRDSNLCNLKLVLLNFISPQRNVGVDRAPERFVRSAARFEMRKFESWPPG